MSIVELVDGIIASHENYNPESMGELESSRCAIVSRRYSGPISEESNPEFTIWYGISYDQKKIKEAGLKGKNSEESIKEGMFQFMRIEYGNNSVFVNATMHGHVFKKSSSSCQVEPKYTNPDEIINNMESRKLREVAEYLVNDFMDKLS